MRSVEAKAAILFFHQDFIPTILDLNNNSIFIVVLACAHLVSNISYKIAMMY